MVNKEGVKHKSFLFISLTFFFFILNFHNISKAQPEEKNDKAPEAAKEIETVIKCGKMEYSKEGDLITVALTEKVEIFQEGVYLKAENMVGWSTEKDNQQKEEKSKKQIITTFDEIYAETNVYLERSGQKIFGDKVFYNFKNHKALVLNGEMRMFDVKRNTNIVLRAKRIKQLTENEYIAEDGSVTTCDYGDSHYAIDINYAKFKTGKTGGLLSLFDIAPKVAGFPIFYWPYYFFRLGQGSPLRSIAFAKNDRFGFTAKTLWGFEINRYARDEKGNIIYREDQTPKLKRWGDLEINLDYYSKRGLGIGPKLEYEWDSYQGFLETYFIHDRGPDEKDTYSRRFLPMVTDDRGRALLFHRHDLSPLLPNLRMDLEASYLSDRNFLLEYFEKESKEGKEQETYLYLRWTKGAHGFTFTEKVRLNSFQNQIELLPQATYSIIGKSFLVDGLYLQSTFELSNIRRRYDDKLDAEDKRIWRYDNFNELYYPIEIGFLKFTPFLTAEITHFEEDIDGDSDWRFTSGYGARLNWQIHKIYDTTNKSLGINKLRHIVQFETKYTNNFTNNIESNELIFFNDVDRIDRFEEVSFEIRNKFQTKYIQKEGEKSEGDEVFDFLNIGLQIEYYPDSSRDTGITRQQNYIYPFNWITLTNDRNGNSMDKRNFSNLFIDISFTPRGIASLYTVNEYNPKEGGWEASNTWLNITPSDRLSIGLNYSYIEDITNTAGMYLGWRFADRWIAGVWLQYELKRDSYVNQTYTLTREFHDFMLDIFIDIDAGKSEKTIGFAFYPKLFPLTKSKRPYYQLGGR